MRRVAIFLVALALLIAALDLAFPREGVGAVARFDAATLPEDLDGWLAAGEASLPGLRPGTERNIRWAGQAGVRTPLSVIYLHGFSASAAEIRPVPDEVARGLGANLFFARLAGHGQDGAALAAARADDWMRDLAEALAIGRRLGDRVVILSTSTGGTLAAIAAADPELSRDLAGVVLISPNFGLKPLASRLLDLPLARFWVPLVAGTERSFTPLNADQEKFWTTRYPTVALFPMAALVRHARRLDYSAATTPALVIYSPADQVIDVERIGPLLQGWAGPVRAETVTMSAGDAPYAHVIAGDIMSPGQTARVIGIILDWAKDL